LKRVPLTFQSHSPERKRRPEVTLYGCCCSCCCCCLHTLGGLIGAAMAPALSRQDRLPLYYYYEDDVPVPILSRPGPSAVSLFWWILLGLIGLGFILSLGTGPSGILVGVVILLLILPGLQLGSVIITALVVGLSSRPDKSYQMAQLGRIALGVIGGAGLGLVVMVGIYFVMSGGLR
jgi:hypothetical protein